MDIGSAEFRERLRQAIDDEINSLQESTQAQALKFRRNALAPISCLPPETLATIFSFLSPSKGNEEVNPSEWICVAHVCRRWRETALYHPRLWSYINFSKLTSTGVAEILSRAKMAPLHLEADFTDWSKEQFDTFESHLEAHISHICHLGFLGPLGLEHFQTVLERLVSAAPALESLSLSHDAFQVAIPVNLFNFITPRLASLELTNCSISWKSPLLKGLQSLKICSPSSEGRPKLEDWLDALNEMSQLKTLILSHATPIHLRVTLLTSEPLRTVTLPSLITFHILDMSSECSLALAHLVFPSLTCLHVHDTFYRWDHEKMRRLTPYVAQSVCRMQSSEPFRSILIGDKGARAEVLAWTIPDADVKVCDANLSFSTIDCANFIFAGTVFFDDLLALFPTNSILCLTAQNHTRLRKDFWLRHVPKWPLLERASMVPTTVKAFIDMLAEDAPPDGPRLPCLKKLIFVDIALTTSRVYYLRDMLIKRIKQGVPLEALDLRTCFAHYRAIQFLKKIVVEVQEPPAARRPMRPMKLKEPIMYRFNRHVAGPWLLRDCYTYEDDEYEEEYEYEVNDEDEDEVEVDEYYDYY